MIPVRLELRNFMSYGENVTPLDFAGIRVACLSGDNGHGKSALLDAMTWALWDKARGSSEELIRLGAEEARVVFDFQLGDDQYRVIRARTRRTGKNEWQVFIRESSGEFRSLTGSSMRDTERVIQRILRMDYRTFINSAYIQQGKADEFTKQTVADRKKILADILDLSRYDALEQKAKERRNEAEVRIGELEREIQRIEVELEKERGYREELVECETQSSAVRGKIEAAELRIRDLHKREAELENNERRMADLNQQIAAARAEKLKLLEQKAEHEGRLAKIKEKLSNRERILAGREELRSTREELSVLEKKLADLRALEHEKGAVSQSISGERLELELRKKSIERDLVELERRIESAAQVVQKLSGLRDAVGELDKLEAKRLELVELAEAENERFTELSGENKRLLAVKSDLEEKLRMLSEPGARCPVCRTELGEEKFEALVAEYKQRIADAERSISEIREDGVDAKAKREAARQEVQRIEEKLKAGNAVRAELAQAEQVVSGLDEDKRRAAELRVACDELAKKLESGDYALEARDKLAELERRIAALEYSSEAHERAKKRVSELEEFEAEAVSLEHAEENLAAEEESLTNLANLINGRESAIAEAEIEIETLHAAIGELPSVRAELRNAEESLASLRKAESEMTGKIATLKHALSECESMRQQLSGKRRELDEAKKQRAAYADLVVAFGKKGVQVLIIENAIPEIQEEANSLLARMTDNAMQIRIETVRDKKDGGAIETLDIKISDDMGTRNYEMYSGGEAFRVNFALRIALSKLLARRAGARLQTLIIDEGFGAQDSKGREKLVQAIDSIRDDFEQILVITHIEELKDAFPTRIEITKDAQGSQISVN